ncbi:MAG: 1-acyl-sn-glycerol-3-phosphate acyltransferase [Candidatus Azotimanducaceae bacterium]|jgi:1-acyl-sn-glycerol-3-phosphate acyltransferase
MRQIFRFEKSIKICDVVIDKIYRWAVAIDSFWLCKILRLKINIIGNPPSNKTDSILVISNHHSWFDIFVLHFVVVSNGPLLKFLVKKALVYVPIIGWICLALNFPRLNRSRDKEQRKMDYDSVASATKEVNQSPMTLLNFVEGTRFTPKKKALQESPYNYLLKPKSGGLKIMMQNLPNTQIIDITLVYPNDKISFWDCLSGQLTSIDVYVDSYARPETEHVNEWLSDLWLHKDSRIALTRNLEAKNL